MSKKIDPKAAVIKTTENTLELLTASLCDRQAIFNLLNKGGDLATIRKQLVHTAALATVSHMLNKLT